MADNNDQEDFRSILMEHRTVMLGGQVNGASVPEIARRLLVLQSRSTERINLLIDSGGGENNAAFDLCDIIGSLIAAPVRGVVLGSCYSAATFVLLHCHERVATPNARFQIHSSTTNEISIKDNHATEAELKCLLAQSRASTGRMITMYMQKLHKSRSAVNALIRRGDQKFNKFLSSEEAVEVGLIQSIVEKLDIFPPSAT